MAKVFNFFYVTHRKSILYGVFVLYLISRMLRTSTIINSRFFDLFSIIILGICAIILCFYLLTDFIKKKFFITPFLIIGVVCSISMLLFEHKTMLCFLFAFIYVFKGYKFEDICKVFAITTIIAMFTIILLAFNGHIENFVGARGDIERFSLGFLWVVPAITYFLFSILAYNYYRKENITYFELIAELMIGYFLYYFTNTRAGFILVCCIIFLTLILKLMNMPKIKNFITKQKIYNSINNFFSKDKVNKVCSYIFACVPLMVIVIFGMLVLLYSGKSDFILKINSLLSGRLELTYNAFSTRNITLFGGIYNWSPDGNYIGVDSAFYHYLFNYGIIPTLLIIFFSMLLFYKTFREKKYWLSIILILVMCSAFIDIFFIDIKYNIFLLALIDENVGKNIVFGKSYKPIFTVISKK